MRSLGADMRNQSMGLMRAVLKSANLERLNARDADLSRVDLEFASLKGADLTGASLRGAQLGGADLTGVYVDWSRFRRCRSCFSEIDRSNRPGPGEEFRQGEKSRSSDPGLTGQAFNIGGLATGSQDLFPAAERRTSGVPGAFRLMPSAARAIRRSGNLRVVPMPILRNTPLYKLPVG